MLFLLKILQILYQKFASKHCGLGFAVFGKLMKRLRVLGLMLFFESLRAKTEYYQIQKRLVRMTILKKYLVDGLNKVSSYLDDRSFRGSFSLFSPIF